MGATYDAGETNITFRVFSSRATRIEVWLYDQPANTAQKASFPLTQDPATNFWSTTLALSDLAAKGLTGTIYYNYRAWGPNWTFDPTWTPGSSAGFVSDVDNAGNRFNPNKALLDPYAIEVSHDPETPAAPDNSIFLSGSNFRTSDTGAQAPRGIALKPEDTGPPVDPAGKPARPFKDEIIYEVNLRGLTENDPGVPAAQKGTFAGAALKAASLKALGVTAVEFQPLQEFQDDTNELNPSTQGVDYWGYNPENYFSPDRHYSSDQTPGGPTREFKALVTAFHAQGLKVYVDMVYNHTTEGSVGDSTGSVALLISWRGLDSPTYYELATDPHFYCDGNTGAGANVNTANPTVRTEIMDALTYWDNVLGADGFRFDLAPILGNTFTQGSFHFDKLDPNNVLNVAVNQLPSRPATGGTGVDLIAEPWALGDGTYQVGGFPSGWSEWNDHFRDSFRTSQNELGNATVLPGELATRFAGSSDLFQSNGRQPWNSVNFLVAHDGFTLRDLYSYDSPQNKQPFPFGPSDGGNTNNLSWDQGGDPEAQLQAARTGFGILMLSAGVPMITGGDEMYRTQYGNNNTYDLDSIKNWLDYSNITTFPNFCHYTAKMMAFRNAHPALRPATFYKGADSNGNGLKDITWLQNTAQEAGPAYMTNSSNHFLAYRIDGTEVPGESAASIYVAYNGWSGWVTATLPANLPGKQWYRVSDTASWMESKDNFNAPGSEELLTSNNYALAPRSLLLLIEK